MELLAKERRFRPGRAILCLLLLCVVSIGILHVHDPLAAVPIAKHTSCALCMAAQLPLALSSSAVAPVPVLQLPATAPPSEVVLYESLAGFSLYMRPPPAV